MPKPRPTRKSPLPSTQPRTLVVSSSEAEIRQLGFKPGEGKRKPEQAVKYRGPNGETWSGVGAMASWLKKLQEAGEEIARYRTSA